MAKKRRHRSMKERRPDIGAAKVREAIECRWCGAGVGEACWRKDGERTIVGVHWQRRNDLYRKLGKLPKLRGDVKVRFVCPSCGGPHALADHPAR